MASLAARRDSFPAPEGTRKRVERWKTGFWKIAKAANVPIQTLYFHYPDKIIGFGPMFQTSDDADADMAMIRDIRRKREMLLMWKKFGSSFSKGI